MRLRISVVVIILSFNLLSTSSGAVNSPTAPFIYTRTARLDAGTATPRALYFLSEGPFQGSPEQVARQFLQKKIAALRLNRTLSDVEVLNVAESPMGHHVTFQQTYNGVRIYRSDIVVTVDHANKVVFVVNNYKPSLKVKQTTPKLTGERALQIARGHLKVKGKLLGDPTTALLINAEGRNARLSYRVTVATEDPMGDWEVFVDAINGEVFSVRDMMKYEVPPAGTGNGRTGVTATGSGYVFDPDPLTSASVAAGTSGYIDNNDATSPELNAQRILGTLNGITLSGGKYTLNGPYVQMLDFETPANVFPTPASPDSFRFNRSQQEFEAVMVYYHIDRTQRYIQSIGFNGIQNRSIPADPHGLNGSDNSHYIPSTDRIAFGEGGVDDAEDATVILHEYGHAIQESQKPGWGGGESGAIGEGFGDYWAGSYLRANFTYNTDSVFNWDGTAPTSSRRTLTDTRGYPQNGLASMEVHLAGQIWSAVLMILRQDLGREVMDKLVLQSHYLLGNNPTMPDNACAIIQADRSLYGGSHINQLFQRFTERGFLRVDVEFVIDDTGSMDEEIGSVRDALTDFLSTFQQDTCIVYQLTTFKDDVTNRPLTIDLAQIRGDVAGLTAGGGGDCPEGSVEALASIKDTVRKGGTVLFVTDAAPHPGADLGGTIAGLRARGIRVNVLLSGDCYSTTAAEEKRRPIVANNIDKTPDATTGKMPSAVFDRNRYIRVNPTSDSLVLGDDDFLEVPLPFAFSFAGKSFSSVFVGSNGYVTFGGGTTIVISSAYDFLTGPRCIAGVGADLYPPAGGTIVAQQVGSDFRISYTNIKLFTANDSVSFAILLKPDGSFTVTYTRVGASVACLAGFTAGNGVTDPGPIDLSTAAQPIAATGSGTAYEMFTGTGNDLQGKSLSFAAVSFHPPTGKISGSVWNDINRDGVRDPLESPLMNLTINVSGQVSRSAHSDSLGHFTLDDLIAGSYSVNSDIPSGFVRTFPPSGFYSVTVDSGSNILNLDFGFFLGSSISGKVFYDANRDSVYEYPEPGLQNVTISLSGAVNQSVSTDFDGSYTFIGLPPGTYTVTENLPSAPGWEFTLPASHVYTIVIDSGGSGFTNTNFGNYAPPVSVSGTVFRDFNNNGAQDGGDYPLAGQYVNLSGANYLSTTTNSAGHYAFVHVPPGDFTLEVVAPLGWNESHPGSGYQFTLVPGDSAVGKDFGLYKLPTSFEAFSKLAIETGGFFAYVPATALIDSSERKHYVNTAFNIMQGGITKSIGLVEPSKAPKGTSLLLDITGSNTDFQAGTSVAFAGDGITVSNVKVISPIELQAEISVDAGATPGFRDIVTVTDFGGGVFDTATGKGSLQIVDTPVGPTILGISPKISAIGDSAVVIISAANTAFDNSSVLNLGAGVSIGSVAALSGTRLRATIKVDPHADIGFRDVTVTTGLEVATESVPGPYFVSSSAPQYAFIAGIAPGSAVQGDSLTLQISGTHTNFTDSLSTVSFSGAGIHVMAVRVVSGTLLDADIAIDKVAPLGYMDVFVTTGTEVAAILNAFNIVANPTGVEQQKLLPVNYSLAQSYPNPFNPTTVIRFDLPKQSTVTLKVYDVIGREVATLIRNERYEAGTFSVPFNASHLASGVYFYSLRAAAGDQQFGQVRKMVLMK